MQVSLIVTIKNAELTDVNVCGAEAEAPELYLIEVCAVARYCHISSKAIVETYLYFYCPPPNSNKMKMRETSRGRSVALAQ